MKLFIIGFMALVTSCDFEKKEETCNPKETACEDDEVPEPVAPPVRIQGSVATAFEVVVNGQSYADIEDFYTLTEQSLNTPEFLSSLGLENREVMFENVQLGYKDLTQNMTVFIQSTSARGYATKTTVRHDSNFTATFPADASDVYQIKASKKIILKAKSLDDDSETLLCWNFSAVDLFVDYEESSEPVILNNFQSTVTTKDCVSNKSAFQN